MYSCEELNFMSFKIATKLYTLFQEKETFRQILSEPRPWPSQAGVARVEYPMAG